MFISPSQIAVSLAQLKPVHPFFGISYLAFKKMRLPIGEAIEVVFSQIADDILNTYYKPCRSYEGYYHPFQTSDRSRRWVRPRYGSTSLQRITTDTFGDCLIHKKKTSEWGWRNDYVRRLEKHLATLRIPAFHLAVWLYRSEEWPESVSVGAIRDRFFKEFYITSDEQRAMFDLSTPAELNPNWLRAEPMTEGEFFDMVGVPPGVKPEEGAALNLLEFYHVGPTTHFRYEPAERLNIITGDNSLGKTFLLECIWWALTGKWLDQSAMPRRSVGKAEPRIIFGLSTAPNRSQKFSVQYNWERQEWANPSTRKPLCGLVVYARHDGSFAVWDPVRAGLIRNSQSAQNYVFLTRQQVWDGLPVETHSRRMEWVCNGLIRDWVAWQTAGKDRYEQYSAFVACLKGLSSSGTEQLVPGLPIRIAPDVREIPTLRMPYGEVPVLQASAGVQRILGLAYLLVWAWYEHLSVSSLIRKEPQRRLVLIIDEVEAHLHPRWQRVIVPALMQVVAELASTVSPQIHLATHSPMIMASAEPVFDERYDDLHHLKLVEQNVVLDELPFHRRGRADLWLISEVFGLAQARSLPAEKAIEDAKAIQLSNVPDKDKVREIHERLIRHLAADDEFWPRWTFFAKEHGAKI